MRRHTLAAAILAFALLALSCGGADSQPAPAADEIPQRGGTAVLGSITDVDSWNEYTSRQSFANYLLRRIYLRLAHEVGEDHEPLLAEGWTRAADGLSITFRLRDAVWSDGTPLTADDVRFTWQAQTAEEVPWVNAQVKQQIRDVEVVDPRTVTFHFARTYPYQLADAVDGGILPKHVFEQVPLADWATHDWSAQRVGSGPFLLERHDVGDEIVLMRNPRYLDPELPRLERIVVRIVPDAVSLMTQLRSGEIDFFHDVPPRDASRLADADGGPVGVVPYKLARYEYLGWNCARPPFDDPLLRRALTLAIDRQALVDDMLFGYGDVSSRPVPAAWWGATPGLEPWPYDPAEARRLLRERGFATVDADGNASPGKTLAFALGTNTGNRLRNDTLVKIQEQLSRVGVEVEVRTMEQRALIQQAMGGDFDGYLGGWNFIGKIPLDSLFGSSGLPPNGFNVVRYTSEAMDADLKALGEAADRAAMRGPLDAIQRRVHEDQPYTLLYERDGIAGHSRRLRGVTVESAADPLAGLERFWLAGGSGG